MTSIATLEAVNTSYVPFNGQQIITAMVAGVAYVAMKPIVENLGMSWTSQHRKLMDDMAKSNHPHMSMVGHKATSSKFNCRDISMVAADGKIRKLLCLPLKKLNGWLFSINPEKVRADIRDKLIQYQEECFTVLHDYWTKGKAESPRKKTTVDERTPLRDAVNMLVSKKRLMYPEAYAMIHQRFNVDSIEDLEAKQIHEAIEYVHRVVMDGELLGKQEALLVAEKQFSDEEVCSLAWLWLLADKMQQHAELTYPALKQLESRYAGEAHDLAKEFKYWLHQTMSALSRETAHIKPGENLKCIGALNHLKHNQWKVALTAKH
ncbi:phage antirepressor Ant [Salmonella enterica]|nr:phage antirepressor Ant [Salmonella enterica]ELQ3566723.1 phage antirepressor Ant [Salmonella enterica]